MGVHSFTCPIRQMPLTITVSEKTEKCNRWCVGLPNCQYCKTHSSSDSKPRKIEMGGVFMNNAKPGVWPEAQEWIKQVDTLWQQTFGHGHSADRQWRDKYISLISNLLHDARIQERMAVKEVIEKYAEEHNFWDEQSKDRFNKGALHERKKFKDFLIAYLNK